MPMFSPETRKSELVTLIYGKMHQIVLFLGTKSFLLGEGLICHLDFYLYEMVLHWDWLSGGEVYKKFPNLEFYSKRMYGLVGLNNNDIQLPLVMKFAPINNYNNKDDKDEKDYILI